jgi:Tfp pilus assembly protein FimV
MNTTTTASTKVVTPAKKATPRKASSTTTPSKAVRKAAQKVTAPAKASQPGTAPATAPVKAKTTAPKPVASPAKPLKDKKVKVVRDSFTIPKNELLQIGESKKRALTLGVEIKKSELIRAGLQALTSMNDAAFKKALASVPTIKTGRPAKS